MSSHPLHVIPLEFLTALTIAEVHAYFEASPEPPAPGEGSVTTTFDGQCYICKRNTAFELIKDGESVNWRETLKCSHCQLINRQRSSFHLFERICQPSSRSRIFITEAITPLHDLIQSRYPKTKGSEFKPSGIPGQVISIGTRRVEMQDVTRLTFRDGSFDCVLSFDVLEHVPEFEIALREFGRVLQSGGFLLLSVPFTFQDDTQIRAVVAGDGSVQHLLPPEFHGDPMTGTGVLCYQTFGMDLLATLGKTGFSKAFLCCFNAPEWGYLGANVLFVAQKR